MGQNEGVEKILQTIEDLSAQIARLKQMVHDYTDAFDESHAVKKRAQTVGATGEDQYGVVIEGVFDGQGMVGPDGTPYTMPANYASKSKLVEGDIMKLTITDDGAFIYKQIGPVARKRIVATLVYDEATGSYKGLTEKNRSYRLLTASVTYYKGRGGDHAILLVPEDGESKWAAVENIIPASESVPEIEPFDDLLERSGEDIDAFLDSSENTVRPLLPQLDTSHELGMGTDHELLPGEDVLLDEPVKTAYDVDLGDWKV